ncbi:MAG TPA: SDR family NAD(P)-dependent oxidoreductase [Acidimicrobiales bacterium]|jgi:2-deoxy-D-gluconate 3-dehydrogenase
MGFSIDPGLLGLEDAVALVTGAGQNIARGCAVGLARAGCHVAVVDLNAAAGADTVGEIEALGRRAVLIEADVCDPGGVQRMVDETLARLGSLEVACNVVGNPAHAVKPFLDTTLDEWNATLHRNLGSAFLGTKAEAIAMIERHIPGRIINFASSSGVVGAPTVADYGAANAGVIHFTKSAAMELARYGLRVNCVVPGTHRREGGGELSEFAKLAAKAPPLGRLGRPRDTAGVAVFLASDLSSYMTGHAVFSDGGVVHTTARPPVGLGMTADAIAHVEWTHGDLDLDLEA